MFIHYKTTVIILAFASTALGADTSPLPMQESGQVIAPTNSVTVEAKDYTFTKATLPEGGKFLQDPQNNNIRMIGHMFPVQPLLFCTPRRTVAQCGNQGVMVFRLTKYSSTRRRGSSTQSFGTLC